MVAVLAHGLAVIQRDILGQPADPDRCASAALFHDASEILTGDLPTPIKYYNPEIKKAYKQIEAVSCEKLLALLPPEVQESYRPLLFESDPDIARIVKAADKLSAYIKCVEELKAGNSEFAAAEKQTRQALVDMQLPCLDYLHGAFPGQLPAHPRRAGVNLTDLSIFMFCGVQNRTKLTVVFLRPRRYNVLQ